MGGRFRWWSMSTVELSLVALFVGVVVGALVVWLLMRRGYRERERDVASVLWAMERWRLYSLDLARENELLQGGDSPEELRDERSG